MRAIRKFIILDPLWYVVMKDLIEFDNQIGYWKKCNKRKCFIALANFGLRLMKRILPPPNLQRSPVLWWR